VLAMIEMKLKRRGGRGGKPARGPT
jgi:hypothetical protein